MLYSAPPCMERTELTDVPRYCKQDMNMSAFLNELAQGIPAVVTHVPIQGRWDPQYFIDTYGQQPVTLENCVTGETKPVLVADFFNDFLRPNERTGVWKLKVNSIFSISRLILAHYSSRTGHHRRIFAPRSPSFSKRLLTLFPALI